MESSSLLFRYVLVWGVIAVVSSKVTPGNTQNEEREEKMEYVQPLIVPVPMAYYGFQYPFFVHPGL